MLFGRPLLEFIARETFAAFARRESPAPEEYDAIKEIHAAWLLTPRDDLGGACPREAMFDRHEHIGWDLQDQSQRWSLLDECPPGLEESSFAFRYGGFGTHEMVKYYDLVRELLGSCWARMAELGEAQPAMFGPESSLRPVIFSRAKSRAWKASATIGSTPPTRNFMDERRVPSSTASAPGFPKGCAATMRSSIPTVPAAR